MSQLSSVEKTTVIELFSTFFDRLSSQHPQRESMLKSLYQFKAIVYSNDPSVDKFLQEIQGATSKSPIKRDNSQTKKINSIRKEEPKYPYRSSKSPYKGKPIMVTTSCGHEVEKDVLDAYAQQCGQDVKCPQCGNTLPISDYRQLTPFEEFKLKNAGMFKTLTQMDHDDFYRVLQQLDDPMLTSLSKQRCQSSTGELFKDNRVALEEKVAAQNQVQQIIRKCLRCNKDVQNNDQKNISYFCNQCKNF